MDQPQDGHTTSVLIAGGGPVGLVLALLLDRFGVDSVVIERNSATERVPKCRGYNPRTMEVFRQLGIEEQVRSHSRSDVMAFVASVMGTEYGRTRAEPNLDQTPSWKCLTPQDLVEDAMFGALRGAKHIRFLPSTEYLGFEESEDGVSVTTRSVEDGNITRWSARWLVGADGANSVVRDQLGIGMVGEETLTFGHSQPWRCRDLSAKDAHEIGAYMVVSDNPLLPAVSPVVNDYGDDRWLTMFVGVADRRRGEQLPFGPDEIVERIRLQVGIPNLDVELRKHSTYRISNQVAASYRQGQVFLVGDAAHRFPPTGIGFNTGVQDAHNLAWKLAFVLQGRATERLLETYGSERRPNAEANAAWSVKNAERLHSVVSARALPPVPEAVRSGDPDRIRFAIAEHEHHTHFAGQAMGFVYEEGAVIPDGSMPPPFDARRYIPSDGPGGRFPHVWLDPERRRSSLDWFDTTMTLVTGPAAGHWLEAGRSVAGKLDLPLRLEALPSVDEDAGFHLGPRGAALVRPDGHVAWRIPGGSVDPEAELAGALQALFG